MNVIASDLDLLRQYTTQKSEEAFAELVARHVDLVYSAALRQVRLPQLAEEIAQAVFTDLARSAPSFASDTVLEAWLYQVARRTAIDVIRREARRQLREHVATEMNAINASAGDWTQVEPLLDDAMEALDGVDRTAILLRYFENKSFREVGRQLGISDDTAQKRVSRVIERLREFFSKRGVVVGTGGLVVVISANAVQAAPVGLAVTISTAAVFAGTAIQTSTVLVATKAIAMTTLQKTFVALTIAVVAGTGIYQAHQASQSREQVRKLQEQQAPLAEEVHRLQQERDDATNQLAGLLTENAQLKSNSNENELLTLRAEVTQLKNADARVESDPIEVAARGWLTKVNLLKQRLERTPKERIPELQFATEIDWLEWFSKIISG